MTKTTEILKTYPEDDTGRSPTTPTVDGPWKGAQIGRNVLLLQPKHATGNLVFAAEAGKHLTLPRIVGWLAHSRLTGALCVCEGDVVRTLFVANGSCLSATSTRPSDRIGDVLVRMGMVSAANRDEVLRTSKEQFGRAVVRRGWVTAEQIYEAITQQSREIALAALRTTTGHCAFNAPLDVSQVPAFLHMDLTALIKAAAASPTSTPASEPRTQDTFYVRLAATMSTEGNDAVHSEHCATAVGSQERTVMPATARPRTTTGRAHVVHAPSKVTKPPNAASPRHRAKERSVQPGGGAARKYAQMRTDIFGHRKRGRRGKPANRATETASIERLLSLSLEGLAGVENDLNVPLSSETLSALADLTETVAVKTASDCVPFIRLGTQLTEELGDHSLNTVVGTVRGFVATRHAELPRADYSAETLAKAVANVIDGDNAVAFTRDLLAYLAFELGHGRSASARARLHSHIAALLDKLPTADD